MAGNKMELISNKGGRPPKKFDDKQIAQIESLPNCARVVQNRLN